MGWFASNAGRAGASRRNWPTTGSSWTCRCGHDDLCLTGRRRRAILRPPNAHFTSPREEIMAHYRLVSFKTCPWVQRSAIALREKNAPFEFRHIESDNRPDWFLAISPHKKVPVLTIDDKVTLFESNAINEYLDEMVSPQLHPADPIQRAINRAWTDYVPTFASNVTGCAYAKTEADYQTALAKIPDTFDRIEKALEKQGSGPFFNGAQYSLVDSAYAPFLQRYVFLDRIKKIGIMPKYKRLQAW